MSLQANKKSIVAFVAGGLALGFVMTFAFGGKEVFSRHEKFLLYFDGSVNGLDDTSLVKFRGVPVGYVSGLRLHYEQLPNDRRVPVIVRLDAERLQRQLNLPADLSDPVVLAQQIKYGLRGKLEVDSYVSGKMYVDLGYDQTAPKPPTLAFETSDPVIPTLRSNSSQIIERIQTLTTTLGDFDYKGLEAKINAILDAGLAKVSGIPFDQYNQKALGLLGPLSSMNPAVWQQRVSTVLAQVEHARDAAALPHGRIVELSGGMVGMSAEARANVEKFQANLEVMRKDLEPEGELRVKLDTFLLNTAKLANSLHQQAAQMQERPDLLSP
jgi:paraquat-inducible protein B